MIPEQRLLLTLARAFVSLRSNRDPRIPKAHIIDWERFITIARDHQLSPILHSLVRNGVWESAPAFVRDSLHRFALVSALSNTLHQREALRLMSRFQEHDIVALAYKGFVLGALAYGDPDLRPYGDIDFVLRSGDIAGASKIVLCDGYSLENQLVGAVPFEMRHGCELNFDKPISERRRSHVELHWRVLPACTGLSGDGDQMLPHRRSVVIDGVSVPTLDSVDHFLSLVLHGAKHEWRPLKLALDIALLSWILSETEVEELHRRATEWRVRRLLALALRISQTLGGKTWEAPDAGVERLAVAVEKRLFSNQLPNGIVKVLPMCLDGWSDMALSAAKFARSQIDLHSGVLNAISHGARAAWRIYRTPA